MTNKYKMFAYTGDKAVFGKNGEEISKVVVPEGFEYPYEVKKDTEEFEKVDGANDVIVAGVNSTSDTEKQVHIHLTTKNGPLKGFQWQNSCDRAYLDELAEKASIVEVRGKWNEWPKGSGSFSFEIDSIEETNDSATNLIPFIEEDGTELVKELFYYISLMSEDKQDLAKKILKDVWDEFIFVPAARGMHHHQYSGLLQHTVENLRIGYHFIKAETTDDLFNVLDISNRFKNRILNKEYQKYIEKDDTNGRNRFFSAYSSTDGHKEKYTLDTMDLAWRLDKTGEFKINKDVVIFSIIFHDIGKIMEYTYSGATNKRYELFFPGYEFSEGNASIGPEMDVHGARLGHITFGIMYLTRVLTEAGLKDGNFLMDVLTCLSAHHGKLEWGSITTPKSIEEYIVHITDYIGSRLGNDNIYDKD